MKLISLAFLLLSFVQHLFAQEKPITYVNNRNSWFGKTDVNFFGAHKVNDITLNPDSSFEFWIRPNASCFTWIDYKGNWRKEGDSVFFSDKYEIEEGGTRITYGRDSSQLFKIHFSTDKKSSLIEREIEIEFVYDYDSHLESVTKTFVIDVGNTIEIPFANVPHINQLASFRLKYMLYSGYKRDAYLTKNRFANVRTVDMPNIFEVEFVEKPQKEMVYRKIKGLVKKDELIILTQTKTHTKLPDYYPSIEFEDGYFLQQ